MPKLSQKSLLTQVKKEIEQNKMISPGDTVYIALSGGADSVCLFDILYRLQDKLDFKLKACHFNHKMRGEDSNKDENFVKKICENRGVELKLGAYRGKVRLKSEVEARKARYAYFEKILNSSRGVRVALAHNANDYAETFLMRIIRGTGLSGLRSIPLQRKNFFRPLLPFPRSQILSYLEANNLTFVEDETNKNTKYLRNDIRKNILPHFLDLNPNFLQTLSINTQILSEDFDYIHSMAEENLQRIAKIIENEIKFERSEWLKLHSALRYEILRVALANLGIDSDVSAIHLISVYQMIEKGTGKKNLLLPHSLHCELNGGKIILSKKPQKR